MDDFHEGKTRVVELPALPNDDLTDDWTLPDDKTRVLDVNEVSDAAEENWEKTFVEDRRKKALGFELISEDEPELLEEEYPPGYKARQMEAISDYSCLDDAESVRHNLGQTYSSLMLRFVLTLVLGGALCLPLIIPASLPTTVTGGVALFAMLLVLVLNRHTLVALWDALRLNMTTDAAPATVALAGTVLAVLALIVPGLKEAAFFYPAAVLPMLFNIHGKLSMIRRMQDNFKLVANHNPKKAVFLYEELPEETPPAMRLAGDTQLGDTLIGLQKGTLNAQNFLHHSYAGDPGSVVDRVFLPVALLAAAAVGALLVLMQKTPLDFALNTALCLLALAAPLSAWVAPNSALRRTNTALRSRHVAITGLEAAANFSASNALAIDAVDLFPAGTVSLYNFRSFNGLPIHEAIPCAAAMTTAGRSALGNMFLGIIEGRQSDLPVVESLVYENQMGFSGWVNGKRILLGNRDLMIAHSIETPDIEVDLKVLRAGYFPVYLASESLLSTLFIVRYQADEPLKDALSAVQDCGLSLLVKSTDPNIGAKMISDYFDLYDETVTMLAGSAARYDELTAEERDADAPIVNCGNAESYLQAVAACCRVSRNIRLALILQTCLAVLGIVALSNLALTGSALFTLPILLGYMLAAHLVSLVPTLRHTVD